MQKPISNNTAIILLSGGLDSTTTLALANNKFQNIIALSFQYQQYSNIEIEQAKVIAQTYQVSEHIIIDLPTNIFHNNNLNKYSPLSQITTTATQKPSNIPATYVPARNILFLSYALSFADAYQIADIYIGANQIDYSNYPDCRGEFINAFTQMANIGTKFGVETQSIKIHAPLLDLKKSEIIQLGLDLGVDYSKTHSCYFPINRTEACQKCDSCIQRIKGFSDLNLIDPNISKTDI